MYEPVAGVPVKVSDVTPPLLENTGLYVVGVAAGPVAPIGPGIGTILTIGFVIL